MSELHPAHGAQMRRSVCAQAHIRLLVYKGFALQPNSGLGLPLVFNVHRV